MITIPLYRETFTDVPRLLADNGSVCATAFTYPTGVQAVKVENARGYFIILPFQGQQIWRAFFDGHELVMRTAFDEPVATQDYLKTYGGFLLHCGFSAMGCPAADDTHPLHGELPNHPYDSAALLVTDDAVTVTGSVRYKIAFTVDYTFTPSVTLRKDATVLEIDISAKNNRRAPMEYMYLSHINFRPYDGGELVCSAPYDPAHVKVHRKFPARMEPDAYRRLSDYMDAIAADPKVQAVFDSGTQDYDPEVCMTLLYDADAEGRGHTMQVLPDGYAHYVCHIVEKQPYVIRWLSRTGDEDACGMALPATSEHNGREQARRDGQLKVLAGGETFRTHLRVGLLTPSETSVVRALCK